MYVIVLFIAVRAHYNVLYNRDRTTNRSSRWVRGADGARLRYHGDFDWAGLTIGNFVMREFGAEPWRFGTADYLSASADHEIALRREDRVMARWDDRLTGAMSERRVVVHEEGVVETLLMDLMKSTACAQG
jgi:hypothetical protein